jgi:hypothetical protein
VNRSRIARQALIWILLLTGCIYAADVLVLRIRAMHATPNNPFETMTRTRVLAIPKKNGKYEYQIDQLQPAETLTCVHSLFPHYGDKPCWYVKPRLNQPIPVE